MFWPICSSGISCRVLVPVQNLELQPLFNPLGHTVPILLTGYKCLVIVSITCYFCLSMVLNLQPLGYFTQKHFPNKSLIHCAMCPYSERIFRIYKLKVSLHHVVLFSTIIADILPKLKSFFQKYFNRAFWIRLVWSLCLMAYQPLWVI